MSAKVLLIEKCGDCRFHERCKKCLADYRCSHPDRKDNIFMDSPDSPPPERCPLLDLGAVLAEATAANPYSGLLSDKYKSTKTGFDEGIEAVRKALKGGGE